MFAAFHLSHSFHPSDHNDNGGYSVLDYYQEASSLLSSSSSNPSVLGDRPGDCSSGVENSISLLDLAMGFGTQEAFFSVLEAGKPLVDLVVNEINNINNNSSSSIMN